MVLRLIAFLLISTLALSQNCTYYTDYNYFLSNVTPLSNGTYGIFLWNNDWNTQNTLNPTTLECFLSKPLYSIIGLFTEYPYNTSAFWIYDIYSPQTISILKISSKPIQIIFILNFDPNISATEQINGAFAQFSGVNVSMVWVRPNVDPNCPPITSYIDCQFLPYSNNTAILKEALTALEQLGYNVGIYANSQAWNLTLNETDASFYAQYPLMYDGSDYSDVQASFSDWEAFSGWETPDAKMSQNWVLDEDCCWLSQITWTPNSTEEVIAYMV